MGRKRNSAGATLGVVAASVVVLVIIVVGAVFLLKIFGGGSEVQRAVDAGNLALARSVLKEVSVPLSSKAGDNQLQFIGVSDNGNAINLRNVNRLMAQIFLLKINAQQFVNDGVDNGAVDHSKAAQKIADEISAALAAKIKEGSASEIKMFENVSSLETTALFGPNGVKPASGSVAVAFMDKGEAANVFLDPKQCPDYDGSQSKIANGLGQFMKTVNGKSFMAGYTAATLSADPSTIPPTFFVPLRPGSIPHLVSPAEFLANKKADPWSAAVPNAVSMSATSQSKSGSAVTFSAYALMEPVDPNGYGASIPHGYIRIVNGVASPASGQVGTGDDIFAYVMYNPQCYALDKDGKALPWFLPANADFDGSTVWDFIQKQANSNKPDYSPLADLIHDGTTGSTITKEAASKIAGFSAQFDNKSMTNANPAEPSGQSPVNAAMAQYGTYNHGWNSVPVLEKAYNYPPPKSIGSSGGNVNAADIANLELLSQRAGADDAIVHTAQSGVADIPASRGGLGSGEFKISTSDGVHLNKIIDCSPANELARTLVNRMYQIYPAWDDGHPEQAYAKLATILSMDYVPMGGEAYIFAKSDSSGMHIVLESETNPNLSADGPWLRDPSVITESPDSKLPKNPMYVKSIQMNSGEPTGSGFPGDLIDHGGDWGYPHPYDVTCPTYLINWFAFCPSSGWNNLLGQLTLGAITTNRNCGDNLDPAKFVINYGSNGHANVTIPENCKLEDCTWSGPC